MTHTSLIVAVDGPAGSGKSSVSKAVAARLGYAYLDTGACYRALAWYVGSRGIDETDAAAVASSLAGFVLSIGTEPGGYRVVVGEGAGTDVSGGTDVTEAIREPRVSGLVSAIARVPEVREQLTVLFRQIMAGTERPGIVVEGRDITTVVAPHAPVRILLTADPDVRAARRAAELTGEDAAVVGQQLHRRDEADSRVVDFMTAAEGVTTVDSTALDFDETVDAVVAVIERNA
ncbi:(d)CMP kinase [Microbacterium sp. STN6]|uniref:(d)CMP kinase n=1 Tax=Microbacterium sp. STN6 TaxID=2995588 RepID=UPI002260F7B4|nr:(d)CMP kinase [Microbacterium sp. STN6]MCX7521361.1 (d)CMP kinase [Microbacterium sp. STN6]